MAQQHLTIDEVPPEQWDPLLEQFEHATVFHGSAWLRTLCDVFGVRMLLASARQDDRLVALWPCLTLRKGPFRILASPLPGWNTAYMGPLFQPGVDAAATAAAFLRQTPLSRWSYINCKVIDRPEPVDLQPAGFQQLHPEETFLLDIDRSEDDLWSNLKRECRVRVKKARKEGLEVRLEDSDDFLDDFWAMTRELFEHHHVQPPYTRQYAAVMYRNLSAAGQLCVFTAWYEGRRVAIIVMPHDRLAMYYWSGVRFVEYQKLPAHNLLHWEAICHARSLGLRFYDFINIVNGSGRFKKSFGPEAVRVGTRWEASRSRLIALLKNRYERRLRRRRTKAAPSP